MPGWSADDNIVPGQRLSGFVLGALPSDILPPNPEVTLADLALRSDIRVELEDDRIMDLATGSARYHTAEGFKVGSKFAAVVEKWGEPPDVRNLEGEGLFDFKAAYPQLGIDFVVTDGTIVYVGVFPPRDDV